jgi:hypothetical protein
MMPKGKHYLIGLTITGIFLPNFDSQKVLVLRKLCPQNPKPPQGRQGSHPSVGMGSQLLIKYSFLIPEAAGISDRFAVCNSTLFIICCIP